MTSNTHLGRRAQRFFLAILLMVSALVLFEAWRIEGWPQWSSAGTFPLVLSVIMLISLLWDGMAVWRQSTGKQSFKEYISGNWFAVVLLTLAFIILLDFTHFMIAGVLFLWSTIFFLHRRRPWFALLLAFSISTLIYALFTWIFKVNLP